jgi:hypothetical protein
MNEEKPPDAMNDGGFMTSKAFCTVGDPYIDLLPSPLHTVKGKRQFMTCPPKKGQTADNWGAGPRTFLSTSEGDPYATSSEKEGKHRKAQVSRFLHPAGFKYSNPMQTSTTPGDYEGTFFNGPCEGMRANTGPTGVYPPRGKREIITELREGKNILGSVMSQGGYGTTGTTIGPALPYTSDPYDSNFEVRTKERLAHHEKIGERKAFKGMAHPVDFIDGFEHAAASKIHGFDGACQFRPHPPEYNMTPKGEGTCLAFFALPFYKPSRCPSHSSVLSLPQSAWRIEQL